MKRLFLCFVFILCVLTGAACSEDVHQSACQTCMRGLDPADVEGYCQNACQTCLKCLVPACTEETCLDKCEGHREEPFVFDGGDYITDAAISIDTGEVVLDIGAGIYVRGDVVERTIAAAQALETVSGLDFDGFGYARGIYEDGKVHINASRDMLYAGQDWYTGSLHSEYGAAYASAGEHVAVSPGDLFIWSEYAALHELSHVLMFRQHGWSHSQLLTEGFAEYTAYLAAQELVRIDPVYHLITGVPASFINNMMMDTEKLYEQPIEYWFDNTFEHAVNNNYAIGFRFMAYLNDVYGDYTAWTLKFNELYPFETVATNSDQSTTEQQIAVLKATYGDGVLDGFYPWLKNHLEQFEYDYRDETKDLRGVESINWYPQFDAIRSRLSIEKFEYRDLYINLETAKYYLETYKNCDVSDIKLTASSIVAVNLYRADGSFTSVLLSEPISLEGISYIKLIGEGSLEGLEVIGFAIDPK